MRVVENRPIPAFANLILKQKKKTTKTDKKEKTNENRKFYSNSLPYSIDITRTKTSICTTTITWYNFYKKKCKKIIYY
jgi:hypothetical protein